MPSSSEVTALASGLQTKPKYRGNVQAIPVTIANADNAVYDVSDVLPEGTRVIAVNLDFHDLDAAVSVGTTSGAATICASQSISAATRVQFPQLAIAAGSVEVPVGDKITVTVGNGTAGNVSGYILIVTSE
tara:strand:+ start:14746 stop:15138 length:393 start_codon:yes stop_codon:yes gene_type:complete